MAVAPAPTPPPPTRPMALGTHGMASTGHQLATLAGLRVLQDGGNAVDAALVASGVLTVVRPHANSIGGDLFALIHDGRDGTVTAINASGPAPRAATVEWFRERDLVTIPERGPASVEVPGLVDGWAILHERFATRGLDELLAPAIALAEEGFPVYANLAVESARHAETLAADPAAAALFLPGGRPLRAGRLLVQRDLARMLRLIARDGRAAFYNGPIGEQIGSYLRSAGGLLAPEDLVDLPGSVREPLQVPYRDYTVYETPPVSQGFILLEELLIADGLDLATMGHNRADAIHHMVEIKKLAFADRLAHLGDPDVKPLPLDVLLSREHAARQRGRIDPRRAAQTPVAAYDLRPHGGDTTFLCMVDGEGNAAAVIQSIYSAWGSGVVVPGTGILLNNRMLGFWLDDGSPNQLAPGKRAMHTLNAFLVKRGGQLYMVGGTPGADDQVQTNFQVLVNVLDHGLDLQTALDATKWSSRPGSLERDRGREYVLAVEPRLPAREVAALEALGHRIELAPDLSIGSHKAILRDPDIGVLMGGASPTRDGIALGW